MNKLLYSILRYKPSLVSGESINIGAIFFNVNTTHSDCFIISNWQRVASFDDSIFLPLLKAIANDIKAESYSCRTETDFYQLCSKYHSELFFDAPIALSDLNTNMISEQIEEVKRMYFQFEYKKSVRPNRDQQKQFLRKLLKNKGVPYTLNSKLYDSYNSAMTYDYIIGPYGIKMFDLNKPRIEGSLMTSVKAWAWHCQNSAEIIKTVILYDLDDENRPEILPLLNILKNTAFKTINIHNGFNDVISLANSTISLDQTAI